MHTAPCRTLLLTAGIVLPLLVGCIERKLIVRSAPPNALVFLDGAARGRTPLEVPFTTYGTREVALRHPRFRTQRLLVELDVPWYQWPGLDLLTEILLPFTIHDDREVFIQMDRPQVW
ncbi:PEGA domain-containing protein, partial [Planctomycetota bacterium]